MRWSRHQANTFIPEYLCNIRTLVTYLTNHFSKSRIICLRYPHHRPLSVTLPLSGWSRHIHGVSCGSRVTPQRVWNTPIPTNANMMCSYRQYLHNGWDVCTATGRSEHCRYRNGLILTRTLASDISKTRLTFIPVNSTG